MTANLLNDCISPPAVNVSMYTSWCKFAIKLVLKAATCTDELTCCNTCHGRATTTDSNNAKQSLIPQGVRAKN